MLKKFLMLPLMAFFLVTLTAATVSEDGEEIFEWEIIEEETSLPDETPDAEYSFRHGSGGSITDNTYIYDNVNTLDIYISSDNASEARLFYNYNNKYTEYTSDNVVNLGVNYHGSENQYIHLEISNYSAEKISFIGSSLNPNETQEEAPDITNLNSFSSPTLIGQFAAAMTAIVGSGTAVFVSTFDAVKAIFWDVSANEGAGGLRWIAFVAILPVAFMLVRWSLRLILNMIRQRL